MSKYDDGLTEIFRERLVLTLQRQPNYAQLGTIIGCLKGSDDDNF